MDQEAVNAAVAAAIAAHIAAQPVRPFKPNGSPPDLDMEAEKESIATWEQRWSLYLKASNIDLCVAPGRVHSDGIAHRNVVVHSGGRYVIRLVSSSTRRPGGYHRIYQGSLQRRAKPTRMAKSIFA